MEAGRAPSFAHDRPGQQGNRCERSDDRDVANRRLVAERGISARYRNARARKPLRIGPLKPRRSRSRSTGHLGDGRRTAPRLPKSRRRRSGDRGLHLNGDLIGRRTARLRTTRRRNRSRANGGMSRVRLSAAPLQTCARGRSSECRRPSRSRRGGVALGRRPCNRRRALGDDDGPGLRRGRGR